MMGMEYSWLLLGLPLAFVLGWLASRLDWRQMRLLQRSGPKSYFRGLAYLLNEQQDKAIDVFVQAVQDDPDTIELHFALGNLFRRRGEYDRAIRVHEHILARADIEQNDRDRAQYDLAQDFMKAGLYDRAELCLQKLAGTQRENESLLALLFIYEREHDWDKSAAITHQMEKNGMGNFSGRRSHYWCEQAVAARDAQNYGQAFDLLKQAKAESDESMRPQVEAVETLLKQGLQSQALEAILALEKTAPAAIALLVHHLPQLVAQHGKLEETHAFLARQYRRAPSLDTLTALVALEGQLSDPQQAGHWYVEHELQEPSLVAAARWMKETAPVAPEDKEKLQKALTRAEDPLMRYRCAACGFETRQYFWQCPGCQSWESYPARRIEEL